ncbi:MAG TPA: hypothetical protein VNA30_01745 [Mycobacteriales bacterium]|nr:hypothetical protein [Mycobacteriales bacterium]
MKGLAVKHPRWLLALAVLLAGVVAVPVAGAAPPKPKPPKPARVVDCVGATTVQGVRSVALPQRPSTDTGEFTGMVVDPRNERRIWLYTVKTLFVTEDAGCTWQIVYEVAPPVGSVYPEVLISLTPGAHLGTGRSAVMVTRTALTMATVHYSTDGRTDWQKATGLPNSGWVGSVAFSPLDPKLAYLTHTPYGTYFPRTYESQDGGKSWTAVEAPESMATAQALLLHPSPRKKTDLWAHTSFFVVGSGGVRYPPFQLTRSVDGGRTWAAVGPTNIGLMAVTATKTGTRVLALDNGRSMLHRSDDDGKTFTELATPELGTPQMLVGRGADDVFLTSQPGKAMKVYRLTGGSKWVEYAAGEHSFLTATAKSLIWRRAEFLQSRSL